MSTTSPVSADHRALVTLRRFLLITLAVGVAGMGSELLLIGHVEGAFQLVPLVLLGAGLATIIWHAVRPDSVSARVLRVLMVLFVVSGGVGVVLHYLGNQAFELEMYPAMSGTELVGHTLTGATPVLAPGSMALLGLVGLAVTYVSGATNRSNL
jgi:hypothetical protein